MPEVGSGGRTESGSGKIPKPRSKKATIVKMGQTEGKRYGADSSLKLENNAPK